MKFDRFAWMNAWVDDERVSAEVMAVLSVLMRHASKGDGSSWPSQATISSKIGKSERSVRRYISEAESLGYVEHSRTKSSNIYTPTQPDTHVRSLEGGNKIATGHPCPIEPDTHVRCDRTPMSYKQRREQTNEQTNDPPTPLEESKPDQKSNHHPPPCKEVENMKEHKIIEPDYEKIKAEDDHKDRIPPGMPDPGNRPLIDTLRRCDPMRFQTIWFEIFRPMKWNNNPQNMKRFRFIRKYWTEDDLEKAMKIMARKANSPGWGYYASVLENMAHKHAPQGMTEAEKLHATMQAKIDGGPREEEFEVGVPIWEQEAYAGGE